MRVRRARAIHVFTILALSVAAWPAASASHDSLYDRLGGEDGVSAFIGETIDLTAGDPELGRSFAKVNLDRVKRLLVEQICALTGGGCVYSGDSMSDVHAGLGLTERDMYGLVEILREAMERRGVGIRERNELLAILAPMKRDVVTE